MFYNNMLQFRNVCVFYKLIRQYQSHQTLAYIYIYEQDLQDRVLFVVVLQPLLMQSKKEM